MTDLSIIIVSFNTEKLTLGAIKSVISETKKVSFEIIVVDNASSDGSSVAIGKLSKTDGRIKLIRNKENLGFGRGNNIGLKVARGRYILLLNTDTVIDSDVLDKMVDYMDKNAGVGAASCALRNKDGSIQGTGGYFPNLGRVIAWMTFIDDLPGLSRLIKPFHPMHERSPFGSNTSFYKHHREMDWLTGAFLMMRAEAVRRVGLFDSDYFMYMEEVDYCFRLKKLGWKIMYLPQLSIIHFGGGSAGKEYSLVSEISGLKTFYKKHMPGWQFPLLRLIIKIGALVRIPFFGKTYAKILISA